MRADIAMVTIDCTDPKELAQFWTEALGTTIAQDIEGEYLVLAPATEGGVALGLQKVPEPKAGKNRAHVDLCATVIDEHVHPGFAWTALTDPAGNEFCIALQRSGVGRPALVDDEAGAFVEAERAGRVAAVDAEPGALVSGVRIRAQRVGQQR
jgi:Glyoxalase-like domain